MSQVTNEQQIQALETYHTNVKKDNSLSVFKKFFEYLIECEAQALALIDYVKNPDGPPPAIPQKGSIEYGFILYWIHHPPEAITKWLDKHRILRSILNALQAEAPPTKITLTEYTNLIAKIEAGAVPWDDGTMIGTKKYEQLDTGWFFAALNYGINLVVPSSIADFPNNSIETSELSRKQGRTGDPVIGILGDWGTGYYTNYNGTPSGAKRVMDDMTKHELDYLLHLGDVYYAGTYLRPLPLEEDVNFLDLWPDQGTGRNFTLNSNHEMSGDAHGYFDLALKKDGVFEHQNGMSYFSRTYGNWLLLGLDSSYYSDKKNGWDKFYMDGAIGTDGYKQQINWLEQFSGHNGPVMVVTHHNACDLTGANTNILFDQVSAALGRMPSLWYWGHVHNGIVYNKLYMGDAIPYIPTKGRCCGHASIPFGNGWALEDNSNIAYYAHTRDYQFPESDPRVKNGYALVTLHKDGGFTEAFYEVDNLNAVYEKTWSPSEVP
ncbi:metallophosphoesterase [uncultured Winogradskyella sp.]|uniref:metallophosphoesterase family protein n=1 Tax=uncultured Winogradskyella sp. TaxID=395353 RepID=UPI002620384D|nr:metallophosphoesterase [uncultured Winogradskyella sp.]